GPHQHGLVALAEAGQLLGQPPLGVLLAAEASPERRRASPTSRRPDATEASRDRNDVQLRDLRKTLGVHQADTIKRVARGFLTNRQLDQISNTGHEAIGLCSACLVQATEPRSSIRRWRGWGGRRS
ncbi:MAG TPA: hypothetical protein VF328_07010, partial [Mycobacterium sp.]